MDQEKIAEYIKKLRKEKGLTQKEFADKYKVSPQAVSKWEMGLNIPDVSLLREISKDYNISIEDILEGRQTKKKNNKKIIIISLLGFILVLTLVILTIFKSNDDFEFKTLTTTCNDFKITGSVAYNKSKSSIYISNIDYCGSKDEKEYISIECSLYEKNGKNNTVISTYNYKNNTPITLEDFFNEVYFNLDNYNKSCKNYTDDSLYLRVDATDKNSNIISYKIPLSFNEKCD